MCVDPISIAQRTLGFTKGGYKRENCLKSWLGDGQLAYPECFVLAG